MDDINPVPTKLDAEFDRDGRRWRVTATCDTFIIATDVNAQGEPMLDTDIIKIHIQPNEVK